MTVVLWAVLAVCTAAGMWRTFINWGTGTELAGNPPPSIEERAGAALIIGGPVGAAFGFVAWTVIGVVAGNMGL